MTVLLRVQPRFGGIREKSKTDAGFGMRDGKNFTGGIQNKNTSAVAQTFIEICGSHQTGSE